MMVRGLAFIALLGAVPAAAADDEVPYDLAMSRLKGCVLVGTEGAPRDNLQAALVSVRSFCLPRIRVAYDASDRRIDAENPGAKSTRRAELRKEARRKIDYELALAVAKIGGFQP